MHQRKNSNANKDFIAGMMQNTSVSPLIMAWLITAILRIATGTGVVSAITAAGIVGPLIHTFDVKQLQLEVTLLHM